MTILHILFVQIRMFGFDQHKTKLKKTKIKKKDILLNLDHEM